MKYRITLDLFFDREADMQRVLREARARWAQAVPINPGTPTMEPSRYKAERCYHDEDPTRPCEVITEDERNT